MMRPLTIAALALTNVALAFPAMAQDPAPVAAPAPVATTTTVAVVGDVERGKLLTYTCQGCHGVVGYKNAYPNYHVPKIGGQSAAYLTAALIAYQEGTRKHPTMQAQADSFSAQDIADITAFLSSLSE